MTTNERDTQFQGFAKLLFTEMLNLHGYIDISGFWNEPGDEMTQEYVDIIAQRAYDFMEHIMLYAPAAPVPDMTEWPAE